MNLRLDRRALIALFTLGNTAGGTAAAVPWWVTLTQLLAGVLWVILESQIDPKATTPTPAAQLHQVLGALKQGLDLAQTIPSTPEGPGTPELPQFPQSVTMDRDVVLQLIQVVEATLAQSVPKGAPQGSALQRSPTP